MNKYLILSIVLLGCSVSQGMQNKKTDIAAYIAKAKAASDNAPRTGSKTTYNKNFGNFAHGGGELTPEGKLLSKWRYQLEDLQKILGEKTLYLGVPENEQAKEPTYKSRFWNYWFGNYGQLGKQYSLIQEFGNTENAFSLYHYELYFMPDDTRLYDVCRVLVTNINYFYTHIFKANVKNHVDFIAVRPTPGITYSPFDGKPMPRIVVGLATKVRVGMDKDYKNTVENLIYFLSETTKGTGCIGTPRYSNRFNDSCVFWAYGSPDNRDGQGPRSKYGISENEKLFKPNTQETDNEYAKWSPWDKTKKAIEEIHKSKK